MVDAFIKDELDKFITEKKFYAFRIENWTSYLSFGEIVISIDT